MSRIWTDTESAELSNLFHTARAALCHDAEKRNSRFHQRIWASQQFHAAHPDVTAMAAYKKLCNDDAWRSVGSARRAHGR